MPSTARHLQDEELILQFRKTVVIYDRAATDYKYKIVGDTLMQTVPAHARPGEIQNAYRATVPVEVQAAIGRDFPVLRRIEEIASATQPDAPVEHPYVGRLRKHLRVLYAVGMGQSLAIGYLAERVLR